VLDPIELAAQAQRRQVEAHTKGIELPINQAVQEVLAARQRSSNEIALEAVAFFKAATSAGEYVTIERAVALVSSDPAAAAARVVEYHETARARQRHMIEMTAAAARGLQERSAAGGSYLSAADAVHRVLADRGGDHFAEGAPTPKPDAQAIREHVAAAAMLGVTLTAENAEAELLANWDKVNARHLDPLDPARLLRRARSYGLDRATFAREIRAAQQAALPLQWTVLEAAFAVLKAHQSRGRAA
jgi:hypothetical protein